MDSIPRKECNDTMNDMKDYIEDEMGKVYEILDSKVSWKHFTWIISTIIGLYIVVSGVIWLQLVDQGKKLDKTATDVAVVKMVLIQADIIKQ